MAACATARSDDNAPNRRDDAGERISTDCLEKVFKQGMRVVTGE